MEVLQINQLHKQYGRITALDHLDLTIEKGMLYGLLGPNGSGKTTTLGITLGILRQTSGSFSWFGKGDQASNRRRMGALLETPNFYPYLNAADNLKLVAHIKHVDQPRIDEILDLVGLLERKKSPFKTYSLGMKQRLAIGAALVGDPEVLILDEPTNGLDPAGIAEVRETIIQIGQSGKTLILASHILDEVEKICTHVGILRKGKLLAQGTVGSIIHSDIMVEVAATDNELLGRVLADLPGLRKIEMKDQLLVLFLQEEIDLAEINQRAFAGGATLIHLRRIKKSLEAEFLEIVTA